MNDLLVVVLLALGTISLTGLLTELVGGLKGTKTILTFVIGVGGVVALDYSIFAQFGIGVRDADLGVWATGIMVTGATLAVETVLGYLGKGTTTTGTHATHLSKAA